MLKKDLRGGLITRGAIASRRQAPARAGPGTGSETILARALCAPELPLILNRAANVEERATARRVARRIGGTGLAAQASEDVIAGGAQRWPARGCEHGIDLRQTD